MQGEMRVMLGRLLQRMEQRHRLHEADISLVREVVAQLDASGEVTRPPTRQMIVDALRNEPGLSRQEIVAAIRRDYGIEVPPNTITGTLRRMETDGMVRHRGQRWLL
jgi:DNA-binding transcriptional ArsR family regulator